MMARLVLFFETNGVRRNLRCTDLLVRAAANRYIEPGRRRPDEDGGPDPGRAGGSDSDGPDSDASDGDESDGEESVNEDNYGQVLGDDDLWAVVDGAFRGPVPFASDAPPDLSLPTLRARANESAAVRHAISRLAGALRILSEARAGGAASMANEPEWCTHQYVAFGREIAVAAAMSGDLHAFLRAQVHPALRLL